jgi:hypothetical protein
LLLLYVQPRPPTHPFRLLACGVFCFLTKVLAVAVYNPLPQARDSQVVRVPVAQPPIAVTDAATGEQLEFQVEPLEHTHAQRNKRCRGFNCQL